MWVQIIIFYHRKSEFSQLNDTLSSLFRVSKFLVKQTTSEEKYVQNIDFWHPDVHICDQTDSQCSIQAFNTQLLQLNPKEPVSDVIVKTNHTSMI